MLKAIGLTDDGENLAHYIRQNWDRVTDHSLKASLDVLTLTLFLASIPQEDWG